MKKTNYIEFILYAIFPLILGIVVGGISNTSTYSGSIPAFIFPVVWTILYILMGTASYYVRGNKTCIKIYLINLLVNYLWSIIFFNLQFRVFAFFWILLLLGIVIYMTNCFYKQNRTAGYLIIPYIVWLIFAAILNLTIIL